MWGKKKENNKKRRNKKKKHVGWETLQYFPTPGKWGEVTSGYMFIFYIHSSHYEMQKMLQVATFTNKLNFI